MDTSIPVGAGLICVAALAVPLSFAVAAAFVSRVDPLRRTSRAAAVALLASLLAAGGWALLTHGAPLTARLPLPGAWSSSLGLAARFDAVTCVVLLLVCFVGLTVARFSRQYLRGDGGQERYARWLAATLAAVTLLIVANNLLVIALAWTATSVALHQLLTFYAERPAAMVAAHKKFLVSRLADLCVYAAVGLLALRVGSVDLDVVLAWAERAPALPGTVHLAAVLLAIGVCLKCAQLPFHGWLTQVMEAPTPVSALLHAGVVNIGGFLMIRLAPLMAKAPVAQTLLVVVGATTAVLGALVMTTRVSVKVALAWSTVAQMGFMLVQCGLGAWHLALLHLVAHSLYKAHAFLSSGSAVEVWRARAVAARRRAPVALGRSLAAAAVALGCVALVAWAFGASVRRDPALGALGAVLGFALAPLLVAGAERSGRVRALAALGAVGVAALYFTWHALAARAVAPHVLAPVDASLALRVAIVLAAFGALFVVQAVLSARPDGRLARGLHPHLFAGLYLDELFTRATFRVWPPRLPASGSDDRSLHTPDTLEA